MLQGRADALDAGMSFMGIRLTIRSVIGPSLAGPDLVGLAGRSRLVGLRPRFLRPGPGRPGATATAFRDPGLGDARRVRPPSCRPRRRSRDLPRALHADRRAGRGGRGARGEGRARGGSSCSRTTWTVPNQPAPFIAVGDPTVADFFQVGPRQLRLIGKRLGATDLSVTTGSGKTYAFEVQVVADLDILRMQLRRDVPRGVAQAGARSASKVVVEGQARDSDAGLRGSSQTIDSYMRSIQLDPRSPGRWAATVT